MSGMEKICDGVYDASKGICRGGDPVVPGVSGEAHVGVGLDNPFTAQANAYGGISSFELSGAAEGGTSLGPLDLQACWQPSTKGNQNICGEFSSLPTPYASSQSAGVTYRLSQKYFGAHANLAWTNARSVDPNSPLAEASAAFNGGVTLHGNPWGSRSLASAEYFFTCDSNTGLCDGNKQNQFALQGLTSVPLSPSQRLLLSANVLLPLGDQPFAPAAMRAQVRWSSENVSAGFSGTRQTPIFETIPINRVNAEASGTMPLGSHVTLAIKGSVGALTREQTDKMGWDYEATPSLTLHPGIKISGGYRHGELPTGGDFETLNVFAETPDDFPLRGLRLYAGLSESYWNDPLFYSPRTSLNVQLGGSWCYNHWCGGVVVQRDFRSTGDGYPNGNPLRWNAMVVLGYQNQMTANSFRPVSLASPRFLFPASAFGDWLSTSRWPKRGDKGPPEAEQSDLFLEAHTAEGKADEVHGEIFKKAYTEGTDAICYNCHVDKSEEVPNPWYQSRYKIRVDQPKVQLPSEILCQKCHDELDHAKYLKYLLGNEEGRHHAADAVENPQMCVGCHVLPVNDDQHHVVDSNPLLVCNTCHTKVGPFSHAPATWAPSPKSQSRFRGVSSGGEHGKTYLEEAKIKGVRNVSCKSCHAPSFCTNCHAETNTHGTTDADQLAWGREGGHRYSGVVLAQGISFVKANQEKGTSCWVCHEPQQNCYDTCHSGKRKTGFSFHTPGMIDRHQGELDANRLQCGSCHHEKMGVPSCRECHLETITGRERSAPPHPVGWANRRAGRLTMHGEAVCSKGGVGTCLQCHQPKQDPIFGGQQSCATNFCHDEAKQGPQGIPACEKGK